MDMLLPKMSRHYVGARHLFSTNEKQKVSWQPKKLRCMILHYHKFDIKSYERKFVAVIAQRYRGACHLLDLLDFISIHKR